MSAWVGLQISALPDNITQRRSSAFSWATIMVVRPLLVGLILYKLAGRSPDTVELEILSLKIAWAYK